MTVQDHLLQIENLAVRFDLTEHVVHAVRDNSFYVDRGETLALVGESGSGKSVTARSIMNLLPSTATKSDETRIYFEGRRIDTLSNSDMRQIRGDRIAMIFQEPMSSLNPLYTIGNQIAETLIIHQGMSKKQSQARALELLKEVMIPDPEARMKQYPHQLSGGQRQRVMIAIAIANNPDLLIADEPTTALDVTVQAEILDLLRRLQSTYNMGLILITHDLTIVKQVSDRVVVMRLGEIVEQNNTATLFEAPSHPYTQKLLASEPSGEAVPVDADASIALATDELRVVYNLQWGGMFSRQTRELIAVNDISIDIKRGESLGIVGESGSGKSTFGKAILRLLAPNSGRVLFDGQSIEGLTKNELRPLRTRMQVVFQDPFSSLNPRHSVKDLVEEGLIINDIGGSARARDAIVRKVLADVDLDPNALNRYPHEFSGGQRQRIAIARALVLKPEFMVLDEPTSALDLSVQAQIVDLLRKLQREYKLTYLFISHDLKVVRSLCHRIVVMKNGAIVETGRVDEVLENPRESYTKQLVNAAFLNNVLA